MTGLKFAFWLALLTLVACTHQGTRKALGGNVRYGDTLSLSLPSPIKTFFPLYNDDIYSHRMLCNVFEPLFDLNDSSNNVIPRLAERYEWKNNRVLLIYLRKGVTFFTDPCFGSASNEMTAEDVKTTLELACASSFLNQSSNGLIGKIKGSEDYFIGKTKTVSGIKIINPYCIEISLNLPNYNFPKLLSSSKYAIFSKQALAYYKDDIRFHPIGTGPFSLKSSSLNEIVLTYNPKYWKKDSYGNSLPYLDEIRYKVYSNTQEEILAFQRQQIDFLFELPTEKINGIFTPLNNPKKDLPFAHKVHVVPGSRVSLIVLNQRNACFVDSRVRKAIDLVIDRNYMANELLNGDGIAANQGIAPPSFYYDNSMIPKTSIDVALGKKLMAEAGFGMHNPFPTLSFYAVGKDIEQVQKYCKYVVNQLKNTLNIRVELHWVDQEGRLSAIKNGKADIWKLGLNPDYADADAYFGLFFSKNPINQEQNTLLPKINSSIYDVNYTLAIQEKTTSKQNNYFTNCDVILNEENWVLPLLYEDYIIIQNLRARGAVISPIGTIDLRSAYIKAL